MTMHRQTVFHVLKSSPFILPALLFRIMDKHTSTKCLHNDEASLHLQLVVGSTDMPIDKPLVSSIQCLL